MQGVDPLASTNASGVLPARSPEPSLAQVTEILNQYRRAQPAIENVAMRFVDMTSGGGGQYGEIVIPMHQLSEQLCMYGLKLSEHVTLVPDLHTASLLPNIKPVTMMCMAVQCSNTPDAIGKSQLTPYGGMSAASPASVLPAQSTLNNTNANFPNSSFTRTPSNQGMSTAVAPGYPSMYQHPMQGMQMQVPGGYQQSLQGQSIPSPQTLATPPSQQQHMYAAPTNPNQQQAFMYPPGAPSYPSPYAASTGYMHQPPVHPYYAQQAYLNEYAYLQQNAQPGMAYAPNMVPSALSAPSIDPSWPQALQPILAPAVLTTANMINPSNVAMGNGNSHAHDGSVDGANPSASMAPYASAIAAGAFDSMRTTKSAGSSYASYKKSHKGTSCHQCKNTKPLRKLAFCSNQFNKRTKAEKRTCRKKYCDSCLRKFYGQMLPTHSSEWICPSCTHRCVCAACVRHQNSKKKKKNTLTPAAAAALKELENAPPHVILGEEGDDHSQEDEMEGDADEEDDEDSDEDDEEGEHPLENEAGAAPNAMKREEESAVAVLKQLDQSRSSTIPTPISSSASSSSLSSGTPVPQLLSDASNMSQSASLSTVASTSSQTSVSVKYAASARRSSRPSISEEMVLSDYSNTPLASPAQDLRTLSLHSGASTPSASNTSSAGSSPFVKSRSISCGPTPSAFSYAKAPSPSLSRRVLESHRAHPYSPSGLVRMLPTVRDVASEGDHSEHVLGFTSKKWKVNTTAANSQEQETAELLVSTAVAPLHDGAMVLNSPTAGLREPSDPKPLTKTSPTPIASPASTHEEDVKMTPINPNIETDAVPPTSTVEA